jgi:hypothetical protein
MMFNRGLDAENSIKYAAAKHEVNPEDISYYWNIIKRRDRWINKELH